MTPDPDHLDPAPTEGELLRLAYVEQTLSPADAQALETELTPEERASLGAMRADRAGLAGLATPPAPGHVLAAAFDEVDRFRTAEALRDLAASEPVDAPPRRGEPVLRRRTAWRMLPVGLAAAAGIAVTVGFFVLSSSEAPLAAPEERPADRTAPLTGPVGPVLVVTPEPPPPLPGTGQIVDAEMIAHVGDLQRALAGGAVEEAALEAKDVALAEAVDLLREGRLVLRVRVRRDAGAALAALEDRYGRWTLAGSPPAPTRGLLTAREPERAPVLVSADAAPAGAEVELPRVRTLACEVGEVDLEPVAVARLLNALRRAGEELTFEVARAPLDLGPRAPEASDLLWWEEPPGRWRPRGVFAVVIESVE